jgi:hypothetical protein
MAVRLPASVHKLLAESGLVPKNCLYVELKLPASGAVTLQYETFLDEEDYEKWATVFLNLAAEAKERKA